MFKNVLKNITVIALILFMVLTVIPTGKGNAEPKGGINLGRKGSISVTLIDKETNTPIVDCEVTMFQVATVKETGSVFSFEYCEDFAQSGVDISTLETEGISNHLAYFAVEHNIEGKIQYSDNNGKVVFRNLDVGIYLIVQTKILDEYMTITPFMVSLPKSNDDETDWVYDVDASPKVQARISSSGFLDLRVRKSWVCEDENLKTEYIVVHLLRDGVVYDTIKLSPDNDWKYVWYDLSAEFTWSIVEEDVPEGFTVTYGTLEEVITTINNKQIDYNPDVTPTPPNTSTPKPSTTPTLPTSTSTPQGPSSTPWISYPPTSNGPYATPTPKLIQTGQLNWPIPVMAVVGIVLFGIGWSLLNINKDSENTKCQVNEKESE